MAITSDSCNMAQLLYGYKSKQSSTGSSQLKTEVFDWTARLNQNINMSTQRTCPHEYGGIMCGVTPVARKGIIRSITSSTSAVFTVDDRNTVLNSATPDTSTGNLVNTVDRYENGKLKILSGPFAGVEWYITELFDNGGTDFQIQCRVPLPGESLIGSVAAVYIGCIKSYVACRANSGGLNRFWGFEEIVSSTKVFLAAKQIP